MEQPFPPDDLEKIPVHKTSDYLTILMEIHNANPEIWDEKGDFSLLHTILKNICRRNLTACVQKLTYTDYSPDETDIIRKKALDFLYRSGTILSQTCRDI